MLNIVLFGPPGAGKGTQAEKLASRYGLDHVSTGELLRHEIAQGTALGRKAAALIDFGRLASDEMVIEMIENFLDQHKHSKGFIFDGFPRNLAQAEVLDALMAKRSMHVCCLLVLQVCEAEVIKRLGLRSLLAGRADDQDPEIIKRRLRVFLNTTEPVFGHYEAQGKFYPISGEGSMDEVFGRLCEVIESALVGEISKEKY